MPASACVDLTVQGRLAPKALFKASLVADQEWEGRGACHSFGNSSSSFLRLLSCPTLPAPALDQSCPIPRSIAQAKKDKGAAPATPAASTEAGGKGGDDEEEDQDSKKEKEKAAEEPAKKKARRHKKPKADAKDKRMDLYN